MSGLATAAPPSAPAFRKGNRTIEPSAAPAKNKMIIARWMADAHRRYRELIRVVNETVIDNDAFGLRDEGLAINTATAAPVGEFSRGTSNTRINNFMRWLRTQERQGVIEIVESVVPGRQRVPWTDVYLRQNFGQGAIVGNAEVIGLGIDIPRLGTDPEAAAQFMRQPQSVARVRLLQTRTWNGMIGITEQMNSQIASELASGFLRGESPRQMALRITGRIDAIGFERAQLIARTESTLAYNEGALLEYEQAGAIIGETILVQWHATLDSRVRASHLRRHGKIFKVRDAQLLLGEPNCRCSLLPYIESVEGEVKPSKAKTFLKNSVKTQYWRSENAQHPCGCAAA